MGRGGLKSGFRAQWGALDVSLAGTLLAVTAIAIVTMCAMPKFARKSILYDLVPDTPRAFGYKMSWIAILTTDTESVLDALGVSGETASNWNNGIGTIYDPWLGPDRLFVSPPVDGWTFVIGLALPHPVGPGHVDKCTPLMTRLSRAFADVQYYFSYPALDFFAWVRFREGRLLRAFANSGGDVVWSKGAISRAEQTLGLKLFELRGVKGRMGDVGGEILLAPTQDQVMQIARAWSKDPTSLTACAARPGLGYIVPAPAAWRAERLTRTAA